ncbi:hypothetical protein [Phenylobacterium sp.]|uniref:hypothetical protein n=1 Tax=Phenylobacterium sp. TaxID=1871053 RepID=UPI000C9453A6|nr:hypothetical protein [Phenylobacterium sp.]MAK80445.1 hypothetical protein [Phenylobacterium sp.]
MPQVFSPGEAETRPLDPTEVVYTTAQKVADLLDLGPQEAVLMSKDADSDAVYITGTDYRNIGFSVGDKIRVYSDADPLGEEDLTITAIGKGTSTKAGSVKITFSGATLTASDFEVADNGYVQNQASFTNGSTRGITKKKVDDVILRMQDHIDNLTHNAWRPYLVSAEYINFDTYKPYRRRYYTDYVGTTPLLFRNVQQILRLELWQGSDYREVGAAEARITIPDSVRSLSGSIVVSPGNGSAGVLTIGSGTANWRADFDKITTAQNLADLINKEDRVGKTAVEFSPAFTLEGSTSNVAVHNEFFATANSDLGSGIVKITSMRGTKAGETCSIVTTDSNIDISQTSSATAVVSNATTSVLTVDSTSAFVDAGVLSVGDTVISYTSKTATTFTGCASVIGSSVDDLTGLTVTQHKLQVDLQGGSSSGDRGRLRDWWMDPEMGIIYFNNSYPFFEWNAVKVSYIYGERYVDKGIEDITTKMVAIDLLMNDDRSVLIPEGTQNVDLGAKIQLYRADIDKVFGRYVEVVTFE